VLLERPRILVIDDEEVIREACSQILRAQGSVVETAQSGDAGLEIFDKFRPDLVLVDLKMPGKSGMEVLEEIDRREPTVIKIVITGYATIASAVDAMKKGAFDFLCKPFLPDDIRRVAAKGLQERRLLLENTAMKAAQERTRQHMTSLVSHELRAPLAAAVQYLEVILNGMAGPVSDEVKDMLHRSSTRLREMLEMIRRWLNLATFDPNKMTEKFTPVDLKVIAAESLEMLASLACENKVSISLEVTAEPFLIKGSKGALAEVFNNLIGNAINYNRPEGYVKVSLHRQEQEVTVKIQDNGIGIDEKHQERVFEEFYRVDGRREALVKGHGLGLPIVKRIVEAHWGLIALESKPGQGTTVTLRFPKFFAGTPVNSTA
jgi:two-component system, sensor histidine kinase and response regulator